VKRQIIIFGILFLLFILPRELYADRSGFVRRVVIDPGHGGRDPGAIGAIAKEKDIVLCHRTEVGGYIEDNFDDVEVIIHSYH
jgi:N-acetylmuramoyl-L-alanine amidase